MLRVATFRSLPRSTHLVSRGRAMGCGLWGLEGHGGASESDRGVSGGRVYGGGGWRRVWEVVLGERGGGDDRVREVTLPGI